MEWRAELESYYVGTFCSYEGKVYEVRDISFQSTTEATRILGYATKLEEVIPVTLLTVREAGARGGGDMLQAADVRFDFPTPKLINYEDNGLPSAIFLHRYVTRQWRRGLRIDTLSTLDVFARLREKLGQVHYGQTSPPKKFLQEFFFPHYPSFEDAINTLKEKPGSIAVSEDFWVSTSQLPDEFVIGYQQYACGLYDGETITLTGEASNLINQVSEEVTDAVRIEGSTGV